MSLKPINHQEHYHPLAEANSNGYSFDLHTLSCYRYLSSTKSGFCLPTTLKNETGLIRLKKKGTSAPLNRNM